MREGDSPISAIGYLIDDGIDAVLTKVNVVSDISNNLSTRIGYDSISAVVVTEPVIAGVFAGVYGIIVPVGKKVYREIADGVDFIKDLMADGLGR